MGDQKYESCRALGVGLSKLIKDSKTVIVASSDLSHFHDYNTAINIDADLGEAYYHRGALQLFLKRNNLACDDLKKAAMLNVAGAKEAVRKNCK